MMRIPHLFFTRLLGGMGVAGVVIVIALRLGPSIECFFFPILSVRALDVKDLGQQFEFRLYGVKKRSCRLESTGVGWRVDHSVIPTALTDAIGTPVQIPSILQVGERFTLGPYWVPVPDAARAFPEARLKITYYYQCTFLWLTEQDLTIPLNKVAPP